MTKIDIVKNFWNLFSEQKWDEAAAHLTEDIIVTWPQSREKMVGISNFIDVNRYYPGSHKIEIIRANELDDQVITTVWIVADTGQKTFATSYFEVLDDKITKIEEYWAEPYPAPEWRKKGSSRMRV